jgi:hypothetical protein
MTTPWFCRRFAVVSLVLQKPMSLGLVEDRGVIDDHAVVLPPVRSG